MTSRSPNWTPEEIETLRKMAAAGHTVRYACAALPGRTVVAAQCRAASLGIKFSGEAGKIKQRLGRMRMIDATPGDFE